jgi:hypothetical protein
MKKLAPALLLAMFTLVFLLGPIKCQAQLSTTVRTVLVIKRLKMPQGQADSLRAIFDLDDNRKVTMGRITDVNDSMVTIKDKQVRISQIQRICRSNGIGASIIGSSLVLTSLSSILTIIGYENLTTGREFGMNILWVIMADVLVGIVGIIPAIGGIIQVACNKHYVLGEKWKLITLPRKAVEYRL